MVLGVPASVWRRLCILNLVVIVLIGAIGLGLPQAHAQNITISSAQTCSVNDVIFCGANSVNELINKFNNGDGRNSAASIQAIYGFFGVSAADVTSMSNSAVDVRAGSVTSSGQVSVGGNVVATGAMTGGRVGSAGSVRHQIGSTVFFVRPPSVSFVSSPLSAFVVMQNGRFAFAILVSCGNVVKAVPVTPTPKPSPPTPTPTPTPKPKVTVVPKQTTTVCSGKTTNSNSGIASQGGNCSVNTTVVQVQAVAPTPTPTPTPSPTMPTCDLLTVVPGDNRTITISNLQTTENGAMQTGVDIDWGDGTVMTNQQEPVGLTHQYAQDGTFTITATVHFTLGSSSVTTAAATTNSNAENTGRLVTASGPNCERQVSFSTPAVTPIPTTPPPATVTTSSAPVTTPVQTAALVNTGPGNIIALFGATTTVGTLGYYWFTNRRLGS